MTEPEDQEPGLAASERVAEPEAPKTPQAAPRKPDTAPPGTAEDSPPALDDPELYFNRELGLLDFNRRVLEQAKDPATPLLERVRFLTISSTNLDEFFEIRISGLRQQIELGVDRKGPEGLSPRKVLERVAQQAHELVAEQYRVLRDELIPDLVDEGVRLFFRDLWSKEVRGWVASYFENEVQPVLTPVGLDPAHPFPTILNKSLNFLVSLQGKDAFGRSSKIAIVQAPRLLPRLIALPDSVGGGDNDFVTLSAVIHDNVGALFPGMKVVDCYPFRVTRNSDLWIDEEEVDDLLRAVKGELPRRNYGEAVRLEVSQRCSEEMCNFLLSHFGLDEDALYMVDGPVNIHRLSALCHLVDRPDLKYPPFAPGLPKGLPPSASDPDEIFGRIRDGDVLLHHPYESFSPVVGLLEAAAADPSVLAIKLTLYRTGAASPMTDALLEAARNGKEVTAVVELRARFDEEANIDIATRLQDAGVHVVYGIVGFKAHSKMMLIVRREKGRMRRFVHLSTGNYHPSTARLYTDFGLLTVDDELGEDVHNLFQQLTGLGKVGKLNKLVQSPFRLHDRMLELIEEETAIAEAGRPAHIRAKMNSLIEPHVIQALYRASRAGVQVDLLVRGICCLRPGVPGVSENVRVRSIVGRFLEHSRIFSFHADGKDVTYCSSADWMPRNFFHRVETAFPIERKKMRRRVLEEGIEIYLRDDTQAWELGADGRYRRVVPDAEKPCTAQSELLARLASGVAET